MSAPFDPAKWLETFTAAGGSYGIAFGRTGERLCLMVVNVEAFEVERHTVHLIGHPERRAALIALIKERSMIA